MNAITILEDIEDSRQLFALLFPLSMPEIWNYAFYRASFRAEN